MQRVRLDAKWRVTIPEEYRKRLRLRKGGELAIIPREDYLLLSGISAADDFRRASKRLAEEIARTRTKPVQFRKLF